MTESSTLSDYFAVIWRRRWGFLQCTVLVPVLAFALSSIKHEIYEGTAQVILGQQDLQGQLAGRYPDLRADDLLQVARTEATVARTPAVVAAAARGTGASADAFRDDSSVVAAKNANLLVFHAKAPSAGQADRRALAYAKSYRDYRSRLLARRFRAAERRLQERIAVLAPNGPAGVDAPLARSLQAQLRQIQAVEPLVATGADLVPAAKPATKLTPQPARAAVLGLALGLILGVGLAFVLEALDRRLRSAHQAAQVLGVDRFVRIGKKGAIEDFRALRGMVLETLDALQPKIVLVAAATPEESVASVVANLGAAIAKAGRSTVIVDMSLAGVPVAPPGNSDAGAGVLDILAGQASLDDALADVNDVRQGSSRFAVISLGSRSDSAADLLASPRLPLLLWEVAEAFDVVLLAADANAAAHIRAVVSLSIPVVRLRRTTIADGRGVQRLPQAKIVVVLDRSGPPQGILSPWRADRVGAQQEGALV